ncbi:unnamed protein product [Hermetia illucens]|uniref:Beta-glucosidase n=1 Tax=Hermetia illucens TaxID=343691 RepID=A0A7R8YXR8_HERIL|nr:myrosinase 1-like [Hermetia illucens]CAD7089708.1 unnamed protein product [Hermetia illucens]
MQIKCISVSYILCLTFVGTYGSENAPTNDFPASFKFGVATAAFQIEGGWKEDGKGPSIWDVGTHEHPNSVVDGTNADIADDSYHQIDRDIEMLRDLGVNFYRFSIAWTRIMPNGDRSSLNRFGIQYYNTLIDKLVANSIEPMVTMYHYDLPYELQKIGGLTNPLFPQYFESYANVLYSNFGDRVKLWITFNEPSDYCVPGYGAGSEPPFVNATGIGEYLCMHHSIIAHARAFHLYKRDYFKQQGGKIGIVSSSRFYFSRTNDTGIVNRALQFNLGWTMHPIFSKSGNYPEVMIRDIASNSQMEGREWSRLPEFDEFSIAYIRGAADFLGLNYYTSRYVQLGPHAETKNPSWEKDARLNCSVDPSWKRAKTPWLYNVPEGLGGLLRWIKEEYNNVEVIITENGWSDDGRLNDQGRVDSLKEHLRYVSQAIKKHGCNVIAYSHWSLMDNFEWLKGYSERFGLYYVNISSPERTRVPKKSSDVYKRIIATRKLD